VVVPTNLHAAIAKDFLKTNIHVLVEKPITKTLTEADELLSIAKAKDLILQVGHIERFNSAVRTVETFSRGPQFIECHRLGPYDKRVSDIGVVLDLMIHDIDIILGLVKSEVKTIDAIGVSVLSNFEDIANARIKFHNQTVCNITASRLTKDVMRKIRIFQKDAYISLDYANQSAHLYRKVNKKIVKEKINIKREDSLKLELKSFINCVQTHQAPLVSGEEGREALKIALEIIEKIGKESS
jgi:predicted dehydrogenase